MLMSFVMFVSAATMGYTILSSMWLKSLGSCAMLERKAESRLRPYSLIGFKCAGENVAKSQMQPRSRSLSGSSWAVPA